MLGVVSGGLPHRIFLNASSWHPIHEYNFCVSIKIEDKNFVFLIAKQKPTKTAKYFEISDGYTAIINLDIKVCITEGGKTLPQ